ncbi:MAG TPA: hypothetical protein VKP69_11080, partial [Isosphaeraceae bacterium]|nr:hypothetical protein [Isosphaeraceae bacterium]
MIETFSRRAPCCFRIGVSPRGARLRRTSGAISTPVSSISTMWASSIRAVSWMRGQSSSIQRSISS